jgi:FAD/FMN-containing dehydrogenase
MSVLQALRQALGEAAVDTEVKDARYRSDASGTGVARPLAVVRPRTVREVAEILRICNESGTPVVPQGGMTGLAGGANPRGDDVVLTLERLRGIEDMDTAGATMTVLAGTPLETCQQAAHEAGLFLGLDLGSRGSCQIGGNLATNAGGNRVIRYGMARDQVLGLEVVLADGSVVTSLNQMLKNNAGYDLKHLFIGSEGTLGIITRAVLRLHPPPSAITTVLAGVARFDDVVGLLRRAQSELGGIVAFEGLWRDYHAFSASALGLTLMAGEHAFWVLAESTVPAEKVEEFFAACLADGLIADAVIAQSDREARDMWRVREGLSIEALPNLINFDVSLPVAQIGPYAEACRKALKARWPDARVFFYGHIGDNNLHLSVSLIYGADEDLHSVDGVVYGVLRQFGGSISAEHGIGLLKRPYLDYSRSQEELILMRKLKQALDPRGILNPGKVI